MAESPAEFQSDLLEELQSLAKQFQMSLAIKLLTIETLPAHRAHQTDLNTVVMRSCRVTTSTSRRN